MKKGERVAIGKCGFFDHGEPVVQLHAINHLEGVGSWLTESALGDLLAPLGIGLDYDDLGRKVYARPITPEEKLLREIFPRTVHAEKAGQ